MNSEGLKLGKVGGLFGNSLEESVRSTNRIVKTMEKENSISSEHFQHLFLLSSRGSFPFLRALNAYHSRLGIDSQLVPIPHIFGLVNFHEIVGGGNAISNRFYEKIANTFQKKIKSFNQQGIETIISDWDEVVTGTNLDMRLDIYSQLEIPKPINIVSFISTGGKNIEKTNVNRIRKKLKETNKKNQFLKTFNCLLKESIEWSDNEEFYSHVGLSYPGIAAPNKAYISQFIKKNSMPEFYEHFFSKYHYHLSQSSPRIPSKLEHKLIRANEEEFNHFHDEDIILNASRNAFYDSFNIIAEENKLKNTTIMKCVENMNTISEQGIVITNKKKKEKILLSRHCRTSDTGLYRDPFLMVYKTGNEGSRLLDNALIDYFSYLEKSGFLRDVIGENSRYKKTKEFF